MYRLGMRRTLLAAIVLLDRGDIGDALMREWLTLFQELDPG